MKKLALLIPFIISSCALFGPTYTGETTASSLLKSDTERNINLAFRAIHNCTGHADADQDADRVHVDSERADLELGEGRRGNISKALLRSGSRACAYRNMLGICVMLFGKPFHQGSRLLSAVNFFR